MNDVLPEEPPGNHETVRVDLVQTQKLLRQVADGITNVDPRLALVQMHVAKAVRLDDVELLVLTLAEMSVDDDRSVVAGMNQRWVVAIRLHRPDDPFELPRRRRAARIEEVPGDVDLERRVRVARDDVLIAGQVHHVVMVGEDRRRASPQNRDLRAGGSTHTK